MNDLSIFFELGDIVELRALGKIKGAVQSGYFKDIKKFNETVGVLDSTAEHKGIYFVLNKINPALYARRPDSLSPPREAIATTSDDDIIRRRWLPIDFDPKRPSDISSTEEEHNAAIERAKEVRDHLRTLGWPDPILADSGNGAHLLYRIDLPNNESATESVDLVLKALDAIFSDTVVEIDTANFNAARIWKAYGTMTRKGANVAERPWRRSAILECPADLRPVPEELLAGIGWSYKQKEQEERYSKPSGKIDAEQWLSSHGLDVVKSKPSKGGGRFYILDKCPWDSSHVDRSAWVVQFPSGAIAAGCKHTHCKGKDWSDLRRLYEPSAPAKKPHLADAPRVERPKAIELKLDDVADIEYDDDGDVKSIKFNPARAADAIGQYLHIISTPDKKIWVYENGYYRPDGDTVIDQVLDRVAGSIYTINASKETLKKIYLRTLVPFEDLDKNPYLLCVKNGVIDLLTGTFSDHSPEYYITMPCPITFDPEVKSEHFLSFLEESCANDTDRMTLVDWMVACACLVEFEYILFLTGHGGNGKHVYEELLQNLFGSDTTEAIGLEELTTSKFALGYLSRARTCISTETNPGKVTTELSKKISGGDWLSSDVKNRDRRRFKPFTQLLWDSNSMPIFDDNSDGFKRRFTRVNMPFKFVDNPDPEDPMQKKKDGDLAKKLKDDKELSGILNLIILRAKDIAADRKIHRRETDFEEYEKQSMSVTDFIECFIDFHPEFRDVEDYQLSADYLYAKFEEYKKYTIGAGISRKSFSKLVGRYNEEPSRTIRILKMPVRGFRGLLFEEDRFNAFIEEKKNLYNTTSYSNDSFVTKEEIVTISNDISKDDVTNVTNVTIFRQYLRMLNHDNIVCKRSENLIDTEIVTKTQNQQQEASKEANELPDCNESNRYGLEEEGEWIDCESCYTPVPPSQQSTFRGSVYCSSCIKKVLDQLAED